MEQIFIDSDVIIDLLSQREPFHRVTEKLFDLAERQQIKLFTSTLAAANVHYMVGRLTDRRTADHSIRELIKIVTVLPCTQEDMIAALDSRFKDFEDGIHYQIALRAGIKTIVTRNVKDYKTAKMVVMTPDLCLAALKSR